MEQLIQDCIAVAVKKGYAAQGFGHESAYIGYTYKSLTGETLIQNTLEKNVHITLEQGGQKASRKFSYTSNLQAESIIAELEILLALPTPDSAESLPEIHDTLSADDSFFSRENLAVWAKTQYGIAKKDLDARVAASPFSLGIECLIVSGGWEFTFFESSHGAKKSSTSTQSCYQIGFYGNVDGISDSEAIYRDSKKLTNYYAKWSELCLEKLTEKLHPGSAHFTAGKYSIAFAPDLAGEFLGEFLGFLSGYAISEKMSPFGIKDIGKRLLPSWLTVTSHHTLPNASSSQFFDGSGITTKTIVPIQDGMLHDLFLTKAGADRLSLTPNGQGGPVNVRISGKPPKNDLVGVTFLFTFLAGTHTIDQATGNFALEGEGYLVNPDGTPGSFVKNIGLSGNIRTLFSEMTGFLDDVPDYGSTRVPTIIFKSGSITPPLL